MPSKKGENKWKAIRLDEDFFTNGTAGIEGLIGIEELTEYDIEDLRDNKKGKKSSKTSSKNDTSSENPIVRKRSNDDDEATEVEANKKPKTKKKKQKQKKAPKGWSVSDLHGEDESNADHNKNDMTTWRNLFVPPPIIKALSELGFSEPTQIQMLTLPPAIMGKRDILGAAETGSGKTLAFGIPIIQGILNYRERVKNGYEKEFGAPDDVDESKEDITDADNEVEPEDEIEDNESEADEAMESDDKEEDIEDKVASECEDESEVEEEEQLSDEEEIQEDVVEGDDMGCVKVVPMGLANKSASYKPRNKLHALVLTPTRELAIQVKNHLVAASKYCDIKIATVVGGMSQDKQERVLRKGPDIVVATPGRLWELIKEGNVHLQQVDDIPFLVIDEADRMLERGHFQELRDLLERMELQAEGRKRKRQTLVFSATLTLVHEPPSRLRHKKGKYKKRPMRVTPGQKLQELIDLLAMNRPKVIDVTAKQCTVDTLTEAYIPCALEEKDAHLYCFLQRHPGRTLVFCNSVSCVRRLAQLFTLLRCKPTALHAQMAQKQRLRSLDKFTSDPKGLLLATDVAARGLDIPNVQHVIHYQVPRTSEGYIHRSGRTARANNVGLTLLLVEPSEMPLYSRLCRTLGREHELPQFPVNGAVFTAVQERVQAARQLESLEHTQRRGQAEEGWLSKAAKELDLHFDEHDKLPIKGNTDPKLNRTINAQKKALKAMLSRPLMHMGRSAKYPTATGFLQVPFAGESLENPINLVKSSKPAEIIKGLGASLGFAQKKKRRFRHKKNKSK